jgi:hypothetical protein
MSGIWPRQPNRKWRNCSRLLFSDLMGRVWIILALIGFAISGVILGIAVRWAYTDPWPLYVSEEGDFEARFPTEPQIKKTTMNDTFPGQYLEISAERPDGVFTIARCARPAHLTDDKLERAILPYLTSRIGVVPNALSQPKAFVFELGKDGYVRGKAHWTSKYIYFILIARQAATDPAKDTFEKVFHGSLKIH